MQLVCRFGKYKEKWPVYCTYVCVRSFMPRIAFAMGVTIPLNYFVSFSPHGVVPARIGRSHLAGRTHTDYAEFAPVPV